MSDKGLIVFGFLLVLSVLIGLLIYYIRRRAKVVSKKIKSVIRDRGLDTKEGRLNYIKEVNDRAYASRYYSNVNQPPIIPRSYEKPTQYNGSAVPPLSLGQQMDVQNKIREANI